MCTDLKTDYSCGCRFKETGRCCGGLIRCADPKVERINIKHRCYSCKWKAKEEKEAKEIKEAKEAKEAKKAKLEDQIEKKHKKRKHSKPRGRSRTKK